MTCPSDLQTALLDILYWTMLEVRSNSQDGRYCLALADHAHNIPHLIGRYLPERLFYYWECERPCFLRELERQNRGPCHLFQQQWDVIEAIYEEVQVSGTSHQPEVS